MRALVPCTVAIVLALLALAAPASSQEPTILLGQTTTIHGRDGFARAFDSPIKLTEKEIRVENDEDEEADVPHIRQIPAPDGPPVPPTPDRTLAALDDYKLFRSVAVTPGAGTATATGEPSVANARGSLLYTGNKYAAVSGDNGLTWSALHPGDASAYPQYDGGFCCDQIAYAVNRGNRSQVFWVRQFRKDKAKKPKDGANGRVSLIVFQGGKELTEDEVVSQQDYCEYAFRPSDFGQITASWFDFNQMSNTKKFLYMSSKAEKTSGGFLGGIVWRMAIDDLDHDDCPDIKVTYWTGNGQNPALVQGAGDERVMHWASAGGATNKIAISRATDNTSTAFTFTKTITSYLNTERPTATSSSLAATCTLADGTDPCQRINDRINTGYRAPGEVGWFWMVRQGPGRPWPHIRGVRFTPGPNPTLIDEPDIWNPNNAWIYPTVGVDAAGHQAVIAYQLGGSIFPKPAAALVDDVVPDTDWISLFFHGLATSTAGANTWGDYESARSYDHCPNTYAGSVQQMNPKPQHRFVWFGRERDACPDLVSSSVTAGRTSVKPDHLVRVHHKLLNTGSGDAPASTTRFYWSADALKSSDDERSPDTTSTGAVAPAATRTMPVVGIPAPHQAGTYYLLACADDTKAFTEISDKNNCTAAEDTVVVELHAHAHVSSIGHLPAHVAAGTSLRVSTRVLQPPGGRKRTVGIFLGTRSSARRGRLRRIGKLTAPGGSGVVRAAGRVKVTRRGPKTPLRFVVACLGHARADRCLVAARPLFVTR